MTPPPQDPVALTLAQACEAFGVKPSLVRSWVEHGKLRPVMRGKGKGSPMYFSRGEVAGLLFGICRLCGNGFKRESQRQEFCGKSCRQKYNRPAKRPRQTRSKEP